MRAIIQILKLIPIGGGRLIALIRLLPEIIKIINKIVELVQGDEKEKQKEELRLIKDTFKKENKKEVLVELERLESKFNKRHQVEQKITQRNSGRPSS